MYVNSGSTGCFYSLNKIKIPANGAPGWLSKDPRVMGSSLVSGLHAEHAEPR